ncbi:DNA internalization-related competence protein ComEC/Rec2 [bacterium]|nr:DNA internalization-related competence protein ComEC/Rec2 [bacterium]MBU1984914.1 DNA internalization-related competence protein ComEC/Rec2 [bacterium]
MRLWETWTLRKVPILPFMLSVIAGVAAGLYLIWPPLPLLAVCIGLFVLAGAAAVVRLPLAVPIVLGMLAVASLACLRATDAIGRDVRGEVERLEGESTPVRVSGRVLFPLEGRGDVQSVTLHRALLFGDTHIVRCAPLTVRVLGDSAALSAFRYGDQVDAAGELRSSATYAAGSMGRMIGILVRQEVAVLRCEATDVLCQPAPGFSVRRIVDDIRAFIVATFDRRLSPDAAALSKALVLGERRDFSPEFSDRLRLTGLSHVFALSGMNVGFLIAMIWAAAGALCLPRGLRLALLLTAVLLYMELGREAPSLIRASLMAGFIVLGNLLYRRYEILNTVAAAALVELLWRPLDILDAGFLLSYLAVVGIVGGFTFLRTNMLRVIGGSRVTWVHGVVSLGSATLGAQVGTLPLVGFLFHRVPLIGALGNLIAVPGFAVLLLWAVLLLLTEAVVPGFSRIVAASLDGLSYLLGKSVEFFAALPLASTAVPSFSTVLLVFFYACVGLFVVGAAMQRGKWILTGILLSANLVAWGSVFHGAAPNPEISFLSVGNGDAILVTAGRKAVLIDTGPAYGDWSAADRILPFLAENNVRRLDAVVLTHPDNDHIGGTSDILGLIPVGRVLTNRDSGETRTFLETRLTAEAEGVNWQELRIGERIQLTPGTVLTVLSPDSMTLNESRSDNAKSLVLRLECEGATALLVADIDSMTEKNLLGWGESLNVELLKIAHHGSKSSSCLDFLRATSPRIAVVSAGVGNRFGHPDPSVLNRLQRIGATVYSTAEQGSLNFRSVDGRWEYIESPARRFARLWGLYGT